MKSFVKGIYYDGTLKIVDQTKLPMSVQYIDINNTTDAWKAIKEMKVRGAPAIAIVGLLGLAVELKNKNDNLHIKNFVREKCEYLVTARPTAVNMYNATKELMLKIDNSELEKQSQLKDVVIQWCENFLKEDLKVNISIGKIGAEEILKHQKEKNKVRILTCCNTGSLATSGYGTALGVIRALHEAERLECAYYTETRPYNQGIRLTGFELREDGIPGVLICDDMVGFLFKNKNISAVVVGADRVAANGDTANKIGTYQIALLAKCHKVDFYIAAPSTSIDYETSTGDDIPIELRPSLEMLYCPCKNKELLSPENTTVWNPSFDITPANLITGGIITETRVFRYPFNFVPQSE